MTTATKVFTTHIAQVRDEHAEGMSQVCELLGCTRMEYCEHQYTEYQEFVALLTAGWPEVRKEIEYSPVFRGFWNNEWAARVDLDFLPFAYESKYDRWGMLEEYSFINSAMRLLNDDDFMLRFEQIRELI